MKLGPVMRTAQLADFGITMHASTVHRILLRPVLLCWPTWTSPGRICGGDPGIGTSPRYR